MLLRELATGRASLPYGLNVGGEIARFVSGCSLFCSCTVPLLSLQSTYLLNITPMSICAAARFTRPHDLHLPVRHIVGIINMSSCAQALRAEYQPRRTRSDGSTLILLCYIGDGATPFGPSFFMLPLRGMVLAINITIQLIATSMLPRSTLAGCDCDHGEFCEKRKSVRRRLYLGQNQER